MSDKYGEEELERFKKNFPISRDALLKEVSELYEILKTMEGYKDLPLPDLMVEVSTITSIIQNM